MKASSIKDGFEEWSTNFYLKHSYQKNRTTFSDVPLLPEFSTKMTWKVVSHFNSFQRDFPKNFSFMVNNQYNVTLLADHQGNANMQGKMSPCKMYEGHPMKANLICHP